MKKKMHRMRGPVGTLAITAGVAALAVTLTSSADTGTGTGKNAGRAADVLEELAQQLRKAGPGAIEAKQGGTSDEDFYPRDEAKEALGRLLFHDKVISGNENISCATCHHMLADTGDGLSLPVGEGAAGLGMTRDTGTDLAAIHERVPRNAPHLFNLGALEFTRMFHDGRVEPNPAFPSGILSPAGMDLPEGLDNVLAAQAMFPVTSGTEMAGQHPENTVATAAANGNLAGPGGVWEQLAVRLRLIPEYVGMFVDAFDDVDSAEDIEFFHAANAIAAWEAAAFRADNSPYDRYLRGDKKAMSQSAKRGMHLFYGAANCGSCHTGTFQTSHEFAAVAMPQIGPGKGDNLPGFNDGLDDFGRERVTGNIEDRFRFRVLSLRNVALTGPWGHDGAYNTLEAVVRHQLDPVAGMNSYDTSQAAMPSRPDLDAIDFDCYNNPARRGAVADACELEPHALTEKQVKELIDFLHALTDPASIDLRDEVPASVPSGLPMFD